MKLKEGYTVPFPEKIQEGFEMGTNSIIANVDIDKLEDVVQHFIAIQNEPMFFILELPVSSDRENPRPATEEEKVKNPTLNLFEVVDSTHKDIYYIDGCSVDDALLLFEKNKELLLADGMCQFGFGCHESQDEIMVQKYNVVSIFSNDIQFYQDYFEPHHIPQVENLITAWDTFSVENPGSSQKIEKNGISVYDLPEKLKDWNIYLYETVEE